MDRPKERSATLDKAGRPPAALPRRTDAVLLVSAEPFVRELLAIQLRAAGCFPMAVANVEEGAHVARQLVPSLVVLDLDAGSGSGASSALELTRLWAGRSARTVVLSTDLSQLCGDESPLCSADLCVAKPFEPQELMRQVLGLLRLPRVNEHRPAARAPLKAPAIELEREQPTVRLLLSGGWQVLDLPWTEHRLLEYLLLESERACSREEIRDAVWSDTPVDLRTVDQYVRRLRRTLGAAGVEELVKTVKGLGYVLDLAALQRVQR